MEVVVAAATRTLARSLESALVGAGHSLRHVDSRSALEAALQASPAPAAAFVARRLPGGDALDMSSSVPLILVSTDPNDREAARAARLSGFLQVPFQKSDVLAALGISTRTRPIILIADDSDLVHRHVTGILEETEYELLHAYDGDQALAIAEEAHPDLVITDVEMPGKDGYVVCRELKTSGRSAHVPVMICSSLGEATDLERGFDAGADDYLVKPIVPEDLLSRVRDLLAEVSLGGRERVLVVDDSPAIRHLVADALTRQGFEITTAYDGKQALEALRSAPAPFELVVTDYDMPRMTGFELVHSLKRDEETRDLPVLMLTARDTRRDRAQMRAAGLTAYLVKPFSADKCVAMVERMLAERRLRAYKDASRLYISQAAVRAAEKQAEGELFSFRASEGSISVLFSDLVGFTSMSASMTAPEVVEILNGYFDAMCPVIQARGGDIDKFIGDAIMAVFEDDPAYDEGHALRAARAAWEMQRALDIYNATVEGPPLVMRIGINSGPAVRGDIGSRFVRRDYTVIGDTVNRAQRYESNAPKGKVLMSAETYALVEAHVRVEPLDGLRLKGIDTPVTGYVVVGFADDEDEWDGW
ncbi:MAG: response regulator [Myxococcota bacterium]